MQHKKGFLLVECMVVFALMSLLAGMTFSFVGVLERVLLGLEVDVLINTIEAERAVAIIDNKDVSILFDPIGNSYTCGPIKYTFSPHIGFFYPSHGYGPPSAPTELIQKPVSFLQNQIVCFSNGAMSSGVLYVGSQTKKYFYALSSSIGEWGVLRLYTYNKNKWCKI